MGRLDELPSAGPAMSGRECYDLAGTSFNQRQHVLAPAHQRRLHGALVGGSVVDAGDAAAMAAEMVERGFDHVRLNADVGHAGSNGSANIVNPPRPHPAGEALIKVLPATRPGRETLVGAIAEQLVAESPRHGLDDL